MTESEEDKFRKVTWTDFGRMAYAISDRIKNETEVDHVIGVGRGGLPLATFLSHRLNVPESVVWAQGYNRETGEKFEEMKIENYGLAKVKDGDNLLLVDDVVRTGRTLRHITRMWDQQGVVELDYETAALVVEGNSNYLPDYYLSQMETQRALFPWDSSE